MINIYLIDTFKVEKNHGLNTYINQLGLSLNKHQLNLTYVWLNSPFQKVEKGNIYISKDAGVPNKNIDLNIAQFLAKEAAGITNPIFHFNWINHLPISHYLKKLTNCITILTKHCIPWRDLVTNHYPSFCKIDQAFETGKRLIFRDPKIQREMVGYDGIDHIITVTEGAKKSLVQLFKIDTGKTTKISNGLDPDQVKPNFRGNKKKLKHKYGFNEDERLIIYAGNINPRKGIFNIVEAMDKLFSKYQNLRLLIAGPGNYEGILKVAKGCWGRITLCGSLDKQTLYDFYALADIGIIPSYIEQCSYTCIEMMHSYLPLMVSDVDGLKEMVNNSCGLRIKVDFKKDKASINQKDLIEKVSFLLDNPKKAKLLAKNAKQYAIANFTANCMATETLAVYNKVLEIKNKRESFQISNKCDVPIVSIIIPCYNSEKHIQKCLTSIFSQSFIHYEIILINDGSTDSTEQLVKSETDNRIVYLKNERNVGIASSLNSAIQLARGKYIARIDADDVMHTDRLEKQFFFLEANPEYGLVGSWHNVTDANGLPFQRTEVPVENDEIGLSMLFYNPISHPTVMIKTELAKSNPYNIACCFCEDYELWFRLASQTKLKNLPIPLIDYRAHQNNITLQHQKEMKQNVMGLLSDQLDQQGIKHTAEELALHCAIGFGMGKQFFNSHNRIQSLNNWLDKVFSAKTISSNYSKTKLKAFRNHLLENYC